MANIGCCLGIFVIFHGIQTSVAKNLYSCVIFQVCVCGGDVGSGPPVSPSGWAHDSLSSQETQC